MKKTLKKPNVKKMLTECKSSLVKICAAHNFNNELMQQAFIDFKSKIESVSSVNVEEKKVPAPLSNCIVKTGSDGSMTNNSYIHQKGVSQKSDARAGK
jgi:hypothetical protein